MAAEQGSQDEILRLAEQARRAFTPAGPTSSEKDRFAGIKKLTKEKLLPAAQGVAYIGTHPKLWPGIAYTGAKNWAENTVHPLAAAKNLVTDREKVFTKEEASWWLGAAWGAGEAAIIYNTLPPGMARLARAAISLTISQGPTALIYLDKLRKTGNIYKTQPDQADRETKIKEMEEKHDKAHKYIQAFLKGRAASGTYVALFSFTGLVEKAVETAVKGVSNTGEGVISKALDAAPEATATPVPTVEPSAFPTAVPSPAAEPTAPAGVAHPPASPQNPGSVEEQKFIKRPDTSVNPPEQTFKPPVKTANTVPEDVQKWIQNHPDFQVAKAAAVGAGLNVINEEYTNALTQLQLDESQISAETAQAVREKVRAGLQQALEQQANKYFDITTQDVVQGRMTPDQAISSSHELFLKSLNQPNSTFKAEFHQRAVDLLKETFIAESKAALVGTYLPVINQTADQALDKLGIADQLPPQTKQAIRTALQNEMEEYVNISYAQVLTKSTDVPEFLDAAEKQVAGKLHPWLEYIALENAINQFAQAEAQATFVAHTANIDQNIQQALQTATQDNHNVVSPEALDAVRKDLHGSIKWSATDTIAGKIAKVNLDSPTLAQDLSHTTAAAKQEFITNYIHPKPGSTSIYDMARGRFDYVHKMDLLTQDQISKVLTLEKHYTEVIVQPGQTVSHIYAQAHQPLEYNSHDAKKLASFIAANYKELTDMHYALEKAGIIPHDNLYPVTLEDLYDVMEKAEQGDPGARKRLLDAVWWIQKGKSLRIVDSETQAKIIQILKTSSKTYVSFGK